MREFKIKSSRILGLLLAAITMLGAFPISAMAIALPKDDQKFTWNNDISTEDLQATDVTYFNENIADSAESILSASIITINNTDELMEVLNGGLGANNAHFQLAQDGVFDLTGRGTFQGRGVVGGIPTRETSPQGAIRGFVWNNATGIDTIPGARVMLLREEAQGFVMADYVYANEFGFFTFTDIKQGAYRIIANADSFITNTAATEPIITGGSQGVLTAVYLSPVSEGQPSEPYILMVDVISGVTGIAVAAEDATVTFNGVELIHDGEIWRTTMSEARIGDICVEAAGYRIATVQVTSEGFGEFQFRFVGIVLLPLPILLPETGGIYGYVRYGTEARLLRDAVVVIVPVGGGNSIVTTTDAHGRYEVLGLTTDEYTVSVIASEFVIESETVMVESDNMIRQDFSLAWKPNAGGYLLVVTVVNGSDAEFITVDMNRYILGGIPMDSVELTHLTGNVWILREQNMFGGHPDAHGVVEARAYGFESDGKAVTFDDYIRFDYGGGFAEITLTLTPQEYGIIRFYSECIEDNGNGFIDVEVTLGERVTAPVLATRYGEVDIPGEVLMGWFTIASPEHRIGAPNRTPAFDLEQAITQEILDALTAASGVAHLYASWLQFGDVNGDGRVTLQDYTMLQGFFTGIITDIVMETADVNADGRVNLQDYTILQAFFTGIPVILGPVQTTP